MTAASNNRTSGKRASGLQNERPKRRKISQACEQCRARKSRCDGQKPVCSECAQRPNQETSCRYGTNRNSDQDHDGYVASLLARIQHLEAQAESTLSAQIDPPDPPLQQPIARQTTTNTLEPPAESAVHRSPTGSLPQIPSSNAYQSVSPVDAMGTNAGVTNLEDSGDRFYGNSSTVSFAHQVYRAIDDESALVSGATVSRMQGASSGSPRLRSEWDLAEVNDMNIFPRPVMDKMLNVYWDKVYHLYPFVHKPTFLRAYEMLWVSETSGNPLSSSNIGLLGSKAYGPSNAIFHCALNGMLALATQFMDMTAEHRAKQADLLAERARNLCKLDFFDDGSLAMVQALLLMAQYLQSTPYPTRCWNCIGIACRMAIGLGLHVEAPQAQKQLNAVELEMCRRVWHGCVMLDTIVSVTLGRPMMLYSYQSSLMPTTLDNEWIFGGPEDLVHRYSTIDFYTHSIKLYGVLADVVYQSHEKWNLSSDDSELSNCFDTTIRIDSALSKLEHTTPGYLLPVTQASVAQSTGVPPIFVQQASVLRARCLHVRMLLYRPVFARFFQSIRSQNESDSALQQQPEFSEISLIIIKSLSVVCVKASISLIETISASTYASSTGAWWYNVFYAHNSGIVILLALACPPITESIGPGKLEQAWSECQELLKFLRSFSTTATKCLHGLERMYRHIVDHRANRRGSGQDLNSNFEQYEDFVGQNTSVDRDNAHISGLPTDFRFTANDDPWWTEADAILFEGIFNIDVGLRSARGISVAP